ncbi:hypothetical protein ACFSYG_07160 [Leeuwenhoekiella polynyae]|uniref:DUF3575 domain-containing protein n=1 Tax=Leeuwenhoekiella polynyae TaxID=1550906 RepID=A0A4Q0NYQ3_9FLAO|nr:hypothetical protein [Leeuwenhoekiella polynyae]RXG17098.1 hypothetical protein DSM02_3196 [Leeuwenhoekiella polynyae]
MKYILFLSFSFCTLFAVNAQQQTGVEKRLFSVNILTPGLEYEFGLTNTTTLDLRLGTGFAYRKGFFGEGYGVYPIFNIQYRYYYNFKKRNTKDRNTTNNSANYLALSGALQTGKPIIGNLEYYEDYFGVIGPIWGLQRYYKSGFKLDLNLGGGLGFNDYNKAYFSPILGFRLGWLLFK